MIKLTALLVAASCSILPWTQNTGGAVVSSGKGVLNYIDEYKTLPDDIRIIAEAWSRNDVTRPDALEYTTFVLNEDRLILVDDDFDKIVIIGSSRGVGPAMASVAQSSFDWNAGVIFVSGMGRDHWLQPEFINNVTNSIFLLYGSNENTLLRKSMDKLYNDLQLAGKDVHLYVSEGENHGLLGSDVEAQLRVQEFLRWKWGCIDKPEWWNND